MIERLNRDFENAWVLAKELAGIAVRTGDPSVRSAAQVVERSYLYPVDSLVLSPEGKLLAHECANDMRGSDERYLELLDAARDG